MKQKLYFVIAILFLFLAFFILIRNINLYQIEFENSLSILSINNLKPKQSTLNVPYINEAPDGNFSGNWKNGCEEASMIMVEEYYSDVETISINEAKSAMQKLFDYQDKIYGSNANSDVIRTAEIINQALSYKAVIVEKPTIVQIKKQIQDKKPIISFHNGFYLDNPNIPFAVNGSYYHAMVVVGYDDNTKEFIVHDDGDQKNGANHRYNYDLFMGSLFDYDYLTNKTNKSAKVIFTSRK
jgi:hypothetical protein